jgi:lipopolysaccharide export system protein LptA
MSRTGMARHRLAAAAVIAVASIVGAADAGAQQRNQGPPNALQGFSQNRDLPVKINAAALEVRDKDKAATFSGDVRAVQGDTELRCKTLTVHYDEEQRSTGMKAAEPGPAGQQQIRRIEAKGGVVVTQKDQTATGDNAVFDRSANRVVLTGNVALSDGPNVTRGDKIVYDLNTGIANVETTTGGRVRALFVPGSGPDAGQGGQAASQNSQSSSQAQPPRQPGRRPVQTN